LRIRPTSFHNSEPAKEISHHSQDKTFASNVKQLQNFDMKTLRLFSPKFTFSLVLLSALSMPQARAWDSANCKTTPRDEFLQRVKTTVNKKAFEILVNEDTEYPNTGAYVENHKPGIYVDPVCGEPLFSSLDKYDSGTGWPSFTKPIRPDAVIQRTDKDGQRTEVRSHLTNFHLGHVFDDGPQPTGKRFCMNSGALKFIPLSEMKQQGYGEYLKLFNK
jgi:methionine-R-sulfoxide reductase